MTKQIIVAALAACLAAAPALSQQTASTVEAPKDDVVRVTLDTSAGPIVVALDAKRAPLTVANFLAYVDGKKYDGEGFYRAMPYGGGGLVQAGITSDARKLLPPVAFESTARTGLANKAGAIAMAALAPGQARSDFFILTTDIPAFDGANGFAVFGRVVEGMDVVKAILAAPRSATKGLGVMKGQMLEPPVRILKATRVAD